MSKIHTIARSTAVAGAALILVVGATFAHDAAVSGSGAPAVTPSSAADDGDNLNIDGEWQAGDIDDANTVENDEQVRNSDDGDEPAVETPAKAEKPAKVEKPAKAEKHVNAVKPAKAAKVDDGDANDDADEVGDNDGDHENGAHDNADNGDQNDDHGDSGDSGNGGHGG